ncbi:flagellar hook-length control protein FliK [Comamonadaceae bacterium PP-2]
MAVEPMSSASGPAPRLQGSAKVRSVEDAARRNREGLGFAQALEVRSQAMTDVRAAAVESDRDPRETRAESADDDTDDGPDRTGRADPPADRADSDRPSRLPGQDLMADTSWLLMGSALTVLSMADPGSFPSHPASSRTATPSLTGATADAAAATAQAADNDTGVAGRGAGDGSDQPLPLTDESSRARAVPGETAAPAQAALAVQAGKPGAVPWLARQVFLQAQADPAQQQQLKRQAQPMQPLQSVQQQPQQAGHTASRADAPLFGSLLQPLPQTAAAHPASRVSQGGLYPLAAGDDLRSETARRSGAFPAAVVDGTTGAGVVSMPWTGQGSETPGGWGSATTAMLAAPGAAEDGLAADISYWLAQKSQSARFSVDGADGQTVDVRVAIQGNEAHVAFRTEHGAVRELLDSESAQLRDMLREQGLNLGRLSVDSGQGDVVSSQNGGQAQTGSRQTDGRPHAPRRMGRVDIAPPASASGLQAVNSASPLPGLDLYV